MYETDDPRSRLNAAAAAASPPAGTGAYSAAVYARFKQGAPQIAMMVGGFGQCLQCSLNVYYISQSS